MSQFGLKILTRVLAPYTFGFVFLYVGITGLLEKERIVANIMYTLMGLFLTIGAILHLLFVADVEMYS